jgi:hypothetical protein
MKRYLPYVFPAAALLVVVFLTYRWYSHNTTGVGQISEFAEGVEIEELSDEEQTSVSRGVGDIQTVQLQPVTQEEDSEEGTETDEESSEINEMTATATGQVRYEIVDGRVRFSVMATLPEQDLGYYQVWLKAVDSDAIRKAFLLELSKSGFMGSAAISADTLPFEVVVSYEMGDAANPSNTLLTGVIQANEEENQETEGVQN